MRSLDKVMKLEAADPLSVGASTIYRLLNGGDPAGVMLGISVIEGGPTDVELDLDEVLFILEGELRIEAGATSHDLAAGDSLWMPKGEKVRFVVEQRCKLLYIIIKDRPAA